MYESLGEFKFRPDTMTDSGGICPYASEKMMYMYVVLNTLAPSFLIGCSSCFGTRTLVHNIHEHCIVLPKRDPFRQRPYFGLAQKHVCDRNQGRNKWHVQQH